MGYEDKHWMFSSDKLLHFIAGMLIAQFGIALFMFIGLKTIGCVLLGFLASVLIAFAKECVYDDWFGRGVPSKRDFLAGLYGAIVGTVFGMLIAIL